MSFPVKLSFASANGEAVNKSARLGLKFSRSYVHQQPANRHQYLLKPPFNERVAHNRVQTPQM
jgi:hypothetical protein